MHYSTDLTEGGASGTQEEGPETAQEDAQVDGADQLSPGACGQAGGTGGRMGLKDPGFGAGGQRSQAGGVSVCED